MRESLVVLLACGEVMVKVSFQPIVSGAATSGRVA
jgi:hypothetical protein